MTEKEFIDRMKRAKSKVKDGISATIVDMCLKIGNMQ